MHAKLITALIGVSISLGIAASIAPEDDKKVVCYLGSWATYRQGNAKFEVEQIDPFACTHLIYGFVGLSPNNTVLILDPYNDEEENWGRGAMKRFTALKQKNPTLKTMVAIGGWNEGSERYSKMAADPEKRRTFVDSVIPLLENKNFDGLDVDWEYPANREGSTPEDKENFVLLLNELRAKLNPAGYLLSVAVSAGVGTIETAYDIPGISRAVDFINVMTYAFHGAWENYTGHHSALYGNPGIDFGDNIMFNSNYAIDYWIEHGADASKLILGISTMGNGWILDDLSVHGLYAPAYLPIPGGPLLNSEGSWGYTEICEALNEGNWTVVNDPIYQTPYAYSGRYWIGFDSPESVTNKAKYVKSKGIGGVMYWSIDTDDFLGGCKNETFPLIQAAKREFSA